jgi:hypothetical protein
MWTNARVLTTSDAPVWDINALEQAALDLIYPAECVPLFARVASWFLCYIDAGTVSDAPTALLADGSIAAHNCREMLDQGIMLYGSELKNLGIVPMYDPGSDIGMPILIQRIDHPFTLGPPRAAAPATAVRLHVYGSLGHSPMM